MFKYILPTPISFCLNFPSVSVEKNTSYAVLCCVPKSMISRYIINELKTLFKAAHIRQLCRENSSYFKFNPTQAYEKVTTLYLFFSTLPFHVFMSLHVKFLDPFLFSPFFLMVFKSFSFAIEN